MKFLEQHLQERQFILVHEEENIIIVGAGRKYMNAKNDDEDGKQNHVNFIVDRNVSNDHVEYWSMLKRR